MAARLITDDDFHPGTRIRYGNGVWGTITKVKKPRGQRDWQIKVWDDNWGGEDGTYDQSMWTERGFLRNVTVDNENDPNPNIHERWLGKTHRRKETK